MKQVIKKEEWKLCWKIECTPPIEVYEDYVKIFGSNIDSMEQLNEAIKRQERHLEIYKEVKKVWKEKFNKII